MIARLALAVVVSLVTAPTTLADSTSPASAGSMAGAVTTPAPAPHVRRPAVRVYNTHVFGHLVRVAAWRPGGRARARVVYSGNARPVPAWANARRRTRNVVAMNGGTWSWSSGLPTGAVRTLGRWVKRPTATPAVGFLPSGAVVFGAAAAAKSGAKNIVNGLAYLVRDGVPVRVKSDAPFSAPVQFSCGPPGTDGAVGCFRSVVARFASGRVALIEIRYASMTTAAAILRRMGVTDALTLDSGGSSNMWTRKGHRGTCADRRARGHCFGIAHAAGLHWERPVVDAIVVRTVAR